VGKTTLYGAISNSLTRPVFRVGNSTNKETTIAFLQDVAAHLTKRCRPWLIFDGHGSHKAAMKAPIGASFRPLMMPKSSCEFNSQETIWRCVKGWYRRDLTRLSTTREISALQLSYLVRKAYRGVNNAIMSRNLHANRDYIEHYLRQDAPDRPAEHMRPRRRRKPMVL